MAEITSEIENYKSLAKEVRRDILDMIYRTKSPHIGSSFSMVELLVVLYFRILSLDPGKPSDKNRDRFLLSKGHGCPALFAILAKKGFLTKEDLDGFALNGDYLGQHPNRDVGKGIEITSGSLGHGLSQGSGMALAGKYDKANYRVFAFLGDGELNEGSVWEAALFASHHKLDNLVVIIDRNRLQALGSGSEIMNLEPLAEKWASFGWAVKEIDGHNFEEIIPALESVKSRNVADTPSVVIAKTIKGKGVSFFEGLAKYHGVAPTDEEFKKALKELGV